MANGQGATATPVKIGPFTGGMNTYSDPSSIADTEAVVLQNFDIDLDGSLKSRPPFTAVGAPAQGNSARIIGTYRTTAGVTYLIVSNTVGTYAFNVNTQAWSTITTTIKATSCVQYNNKVYLVAPVGSASPGGSWDATTFSAVATMPKGECCTIYKERMFIGQGANGASTVYFSPAADPSAAWNSADFLYVSKGDGQSLVDIRTFNNVIVVFKENSTYIFAYDSAPTRGTVQQVSPVVGVQDRQCVVDYENSLFVYDGATVYQVTNWNFDPINIRVPFNYQNAAPANNLYPRSLSVVGNRLLIRYYDLIYCYNLKTRGWSMWTSTLFPGKLVKSTLFTASDAIVDYYAVPWNTTATALYKFRDGYTLTDTENFPVQLVTKAYNVNVPYTFKRLLWWGIDLFARTTVNARVSPITFGKRYTWGQLLGHSWDSLGTWDDLLGISIDVTDTAFLTTSSNVRSFVKYLKSLRFRQVQFVIDSTVTGSSNDSPLRIFSLVAVASNKQVVPDKIN
jgi:hypothetical protein